MRDHVSTQLFLAIAFFSLILAVVVMTFYSAYMGTAAGELSTPAIDFSNAVFCTICIVYLCLVDSPGFRDWFRNIVLIFLLGLITVFVMLRVYDQSSKEQSYCLWVLGALLLVVAIYDLVKSIKWEQLKNKTNKTPQELAVLNSVYAPQPPPQGPYPAYAPSPFPLNGPQAL